MFSKNIILVVTAILALIKISESAIELTSLTDIDDYRIVCYYGSWAASRTGVGRFTPENINPFLCTHLLYAFARLTKDITFTPLNEIVDIEQGGYAKFTGLKKYNKKLKTSLSLGGWNEGSVRFASIASNATKRSIFIKNCIKYLRQYNFDGLDLDWQFPNLKDRNSYSALIQEIREGFELEAKAAGRTRLRLAITLPTLVDHVNRGYNIALLTKYVDCMHALTFNYHTEFEPLVYHHSQLYSVDDISDHEVNANYTMAFYLESGANRKTLALGIPTYGKVYNLSDPNLTDIGSPAVGPGIKGEMTNESGFLAYYEICRKIKDEGWIVKQPYPNAMGQYAYKGNQWVGYDDENIMRKKGEYVGKHKLGGMMFWLMEYDDFHGYCGGKQFPLIEAAKEGLLSAIALHDTTVESGSTEKINVAPYESPTNTIDFSSTQRIFIRDSPQSSDTKLNNNKFNGQLELIQPIDEKYLDDEKLLTQLRNLMAESGGIEGLRKFLNMFETAGSKSKPEISYEEFPKSEIFQSDVKNNKPIRQTYNEKSGGDQPSGVSQPFATEEFKNGSKILNIVFHINFK